MKIIYLITLLTLLFGTGVLATLTTVDIDGTQKITEDATIRFLNNVYARFTSSLDLRVGLKGCEEVANNETWFSYADWDITEIPPDAVIESVGVELRVDTVDDDSQTIEITKLTKKGADFDNNQAGNTGLFKEIRNGEVLASQAVTSTGTSILSLNPVGIQSFQDSISSGEWFFGIKSDAAGDLPTCPTTDTSIYDIKSQEDGEPGIHLLITYTKGVVMYPGVIVKDGNYTYIVIANVTAKHFNMTTDGFYIDQIEFCGSTKKGLFSTDRLCRFLNSVLGLLTSNDRTFGLNPFRRF